MWSKFLLVDASFGSGEWLTAAAMIVSSLLTIAYLLPVAFARAVRAGGRQGPGLRRGRAARPAPALAAVGITALGCLALFVLAESDRGLSRADRRLTLMEVAP